MRARLKRKVYSAYSSEWENIGVYFSGAINRLIAARKKPTGSCPFQLTSFDLG